MPEDPSLFHGIAVLIDDEIWDEGATVRAIQQQIEDAGCHVVSMTSLPTEAKVSNLREVAFFVLDWNLYGKGLKDLAAGGEVVVPRGMKEANAANAINFLKELKKVRFAPVVIFTDENVDEVKEKLKEHEDLDPSHILVMRKADVTTEGVFTVLSKWMKDAPSVYVLKKWERAYEKAKNELFLDFYAKSVLWPIVLWKTYQDDHLSASVELGSLIGRNLLSRMTPFDFDLDPIIDEMKEKGEEAKSIGVVLKVLAGERFLPKERLHDDGIAPGDVFKKKGSYYINVRPDCDCIEREGGPLDGIKLYLLKGSKFTENQVNERYKSKYGTLSESDNEALVFQMIEGRTVCFQFRDLLIEDWGAWKASRIGRLLPPFSTRLQQRYAGYLQRPGLTRVPRAAFPPDPEPKVDEAVVPKAAPVQPPMEAIAELEKAAPAPVEPLPSEAPPDAKI